MKAPNDAQLAAAAETFSLLATSTRLGIVWLLVHNEHDVTTLAAEIGASIQSVSQHLGKLRLAGVVTSRREGRRIFYAVEDPHVVTMVDEIFEHIAEDGSVAPDPAPRRPRPVTEE